MNFFDFSSYLKANAYLSVSLLFYSILFSLILILFLQVFKTKKNQLDILYSRFILVCVFMNLANLIACLVNGQQGEIHYYIVYISNFLVFIFAYLAIVPFSKFYITYLNQKEIETRNLESMINLLVKISIVMTFILTFTKWYYWVDSNNYYVEGNIFWLSSFMAVVCLAPLFVVQLKNLDKFIKREKIAFLIFIGLPILTFIYELISKENWYLFPVASLVIIGIYIFILSDQSHMFYMNKIELEKNKNAMMMSRIQPDFLQDSLMSIQDLCIVNPAIASDALEHFSYYLRGNLNTLTSQDLISFSNETQYVKDYLFLEQIKYADKLEVTWDIQVESLMVPPMTLYIPVHNAILLNAKENKSIIKIKISTKIIKNEIEISIVDNGVGFKEIGKNGIPHNDEDLKNIGELIEKRCGGKLRIKSKQGEGTHVRITIPINTSKSKWN